MFVALFVVLCWVLVFAVWATQLDLEQSDMGLNVHMKCVSCLIKKLS